MVKQIKHVVLNRPKRMVATNDDPTRGSEENPYSIDEAYSLYYAGLWVGGWVECYGYIPADLEDWGYYGSDSGTSGSSDPYEEEINPDDGDDGHGLGGNGDENGENGNQGGENQNGNQGNGNAGGGNGNPSDNTRCLIRTIFNHTACDGPILSGYTCMIHSHPNGAEASDIDRHVAYLYSKHNYVYFAIYDSKKHILRSYQPFNDYEESIWEQNH